MDNLRCQAHGMKLCTDCATVELPYERYRELLAALDTCRADLAVANARYEAQVKRLQDAIERAKDVPCPECGHRLSVACTCRVERDAALAALADERQYRDVAELEAAEYRAALTSESVLIDHDDLIVPICLVCDAIAEHVDEIEHKPDCLLARPAGTRGAEVLAAITAARAFVEHHDAGQAPNQPRTLGEDDIWHAEWDRRLDALRRALGGGGMGDTNA